MPPEIAEKTSPRSAECKSSLPDVTGLGSGSSGSRLAEVMLGILHDLDTEILLHLAFAKDLVDLIPDLLDILDLDFERLARASNCGGRIIADNVPFSDPARQVLAAGAEQRAQLLTGGDDYELLLTIPLENSKAFLAAAGNFDFAVSQIGTCTKGPGEIECRTASGDILDFERSGYDHFQTGSNNKR